jgi:hypothetical protein
MRGDGETDSDATLSDGSIGITEGSAAGGGGGGGNSLRGLLDVLRRTLVGAKRPSDRAADVPPPTRARTNVRCSARPRRTCLYWTAMRT